MGSGRKHVILGVHFEHDAGAAIIVDGNIVADVSEERFNRSKHSGDDPFSSIGYCLEAAGVSISDVDEIAVPSLDDGEPIAIVATHLGLGIWERRRQTRQLMRVLDGIGASVDIMVSIRGHNHGLHFFFFG